MMTNKKIVVRHHLKIKNVFFSHNQHIQKSTEGNNYCERLLLFDIPFSFSSTLIYDEMMRSIFHKYKALQKNIDTKLILKDALMIFLFFRTLLRSFSFTLYEWSIAKVIKITQIEFYRFLI